LNDLGVLNNIIPNLTRSLTPNAILKSIFKKLSKEDEFNQKDHFKNTRIFGMRVFAGFII
jgi:hypothetical protein